MRRIAFLLAIFSIFTMCEAVYPQQQGHPEYLHTVIMPSMPDEMYFAGEKVPLENTDTYESLQRELLVTSYMHSRTYITLLNIGRYFPVIEPILERNGIPDDFKYLCMAESGLTPEILSPAGAAGMWQIMPETARLHGLQTGPEVDERYHVEKSTEAACRYLNEAYAIFGSWTLAAASYNVGMNGVARRIDSQGVTNYYDAFFPAETMRYVFRILSFKLIVENPEVYGFHIDESDYYKQLTYYREVIVEGQNIDWNKVAADNGTTYKQMRIFNPWIRDYSHGNKEGRSYVVRIPYPQFRTRPAAKQEAVEASSDNSDAKSSSAKSKKRVKSKRDRRN